MRSVLCFSYTLHTQKRALWQDPLCHPLTPPHDTLSLAAVLTLIYSPQVTSQMPTKCCSSHTGLATHGGPSATWLTSEGEGRGHAPLTAPRQGMRQDRGKGLCPQVWKWLWPPGLMPGFSAPLLGSLGLDMTGHAHGNEDQLMNGTVSAGCPRGLRAAKFWGPRGRLDYRTEAVMGQLSGLGMAKHMSH